MLNGAATRGQRVLLFAVVGVVFAYLIVTAREPLRLNWGDSWSESNVLTAMNYSAKHGFVATSFIEVYDVGPLTADSYRYTHYPPFAAIFYGAIRKIAGGATLDISVLRLFAIAWSGLGVWSFHRYVVALWGPRIAGWATILLTTNLLWLQFADSIHQAAILFSSGMTVLAAIPGYLRGERRLAAVLGFGTYVCFLTAYDFYFFIPIASLLTAAVLGVAPLSKRMIGFATIVALGGALAIVTKAACVTGVLGWQGFLDDVHFQFLERATSKYSADYRAGFPTVLAVRWLSYFTPLAFVAAVVVIAQAFRKRPGGSIAILLAAGLPFLVILSELAVEQLLPSQVLLPFYAVGVGYCVHWLHEKRPQFAYATIAAVVVWQGAMMAHLPKSFLDREANTKVVDYLRQNDANDFVVTNLLSEGTVQYFLERHMLLPVDTVAWTPNYYLELAAKTESGIVHAVHYDDPGRLIDKGLWYMLPRKRQWKLVGAPHFFGAETRAEVASWDARWLEGLQRSGTEVMHLPGVRVFRIDVAVAARREAARQKLATAPPANAYDFGDDEAAFQRLAGFRLVERYPGTPAFCWTVERTPHRSFLTRLGLRFRPSAPPLRESLLALKLDAAHDQRVRLLAWGAIPRQTLTVSIDGHEVLPATDLGDAQSRHEISFVIPKDLLRGDPIKELAFGFRDVGEYQSGVALADLRIEPLL